MDELLALAHMGQKINPTNKLHGVLLTVEATGAEIPKLLLSNPTSLQTIKSGLSLEGTLFFNDASRYWLATATNWGIYWNTTDNRVEFHGGGTNRAWVDLDDGSAKFAGLTATTGNFSGMVKNTNSYFEVDQATTADWAFVSRVNGSINPAHFAMNAAGELQWGDGTTTRDTNLYRSAANTLKTDDSLVIGGDLTFTKNQATINFNNGDLNNVNKLVFMDPGPGEGIEWLTGNLWKIYESPDDLTTNSAGNLQFVQNATRRMTLRSDGGIDIPGYLHIGNVDIGATGHTAFNPVWAAVRMGRKIFADEDFSIGNNSVTTYSGSTITRIDMADAPNVSRKVIEVKATAVSTPGFAGFVQSYNTAASKTFVQVFRAKIPVGYRLNDASNGRGTGGFCYWISSRDGTGKWEEYIRVTHCGSTGTFSSSGHVYLSKTTGADPTAGAPVIMYLASCTTYDVTDFTGFNTESLQIGGTTVLDASRNMTNIGTISAGTITTSGDLVITGGFKSSTAHQFYNASTGAQQVHMGSLLVSSAFTDATNVPANGAYIKGDARVDGILTSPTAAVGNIAYTAYVIGDSQARYVVFGDGKTEWGAGGTTTRDTNLYRSAANVLKTDDGFQAASFAVGTTAVIDGSRNLVNIGTLGLSGNITFTNAGDRTITFTATAAGTAGRALILDAGNTTAGTANISGGDLDLRSGQSTGNGTSRVEFWTPTPGTAGATTLNALASRGWIDSGGLTLAGNATINSPAGYIDLRATQSSYNNGIILRRSVANTSAWANIGMASDAELFIGVLSATVGVKISNTGSLVASGSISAANIKRGTVTIPAGSTSVTWTHSYNGTNYQVSLTPNSPSRHVYYSAKAANSIVVNVDDSDTTAIDVDCLLIGA